MHGQSVCDGLHLRSTILARVSTSFGLQRGWATAAAMAGGMLATFGPAAAQSLIEEVKLGVLYHDASHLWSGFRIEDQGADINGEVLLRPTIPVYIGTIRPVVGGTLATNGGTSHAYADLRWQSELGAGFFLGLGFGGAIHDGHLLPDS